MLGAFKRTILYHFGSMCFGAALLRIATVLLFILTYLSEKLRVSVPDGATQVISKIVRCCLKCVVCCIQRFVKYLTTSAYVIIAIQGGSFCESTRRAYILMHSQTRLLVMTSFAADVLMTLITLSVAMFCTFTVLVTLKYVNEIPNSFFAAIGMSEVSAVRDPSLPVAVTFCFSYFVSEAFVDVLQTTIDAVFMCYCADVKLNKKEGQLARNMLALEEIKQADRIVQDEEARTQVAKASAHSRVQAADRNAAKGKLTVQTSEPDDVAEESDPAWLEEGGNGNPMRPPATQQSKKVVL